MDNQYEYDEFLSNPKIEASLTCSLDLNFCIEQGFGLDGLPNYELYELLYIWDWNQQGKMNQKCKNNRQWKHNGH